jgi:hypothetical protein
LEVVGVDRPAASGDYLVQMEFQPVGWDSLFLGHQKFALVESLRNVAYEL